MRRVKTLFMFKDSQFPSLEFLSLPANWSTKRKKKFFALFTCNLLCLNNLFNSSVHFFSGMIYVYLGQFNSLTTTKNVLLYLLIVFEKYFCSNIANNTHLFQLKPSGFSCHVIFSSLSEDCMKLKNTVLLLSKQNFN